MLKRNRSMGFGNEFRFEPIVAPGRCIDHLEGGLGGRMDQLNRAVRLIDEGAPQTRVAIQHDLEGATQGFQIEWSANARAEMEVISGALGIQAMEKPESALAERQ